MNSIFVTGISTEVGKTVASAVIVEALEADYWKPVQAGDLEDSDSHKVKNWISNSRTRIHPNAYGLQTPMSPHAAAAIDNIQIKKEAIHRPHTDNDLVIEGAGGLLVPLNATDTIADLILAGDRVVVVSRHYLGSINHTLLTLGAPALHGRDVALLYVGDEHPTTEAIIEHKTGVRVLGRLPWLSELNPGAIQALAGHLRPGLQSWLYP